MRISFTRTAIVLCFLLATFFLLQDVSGVVGTPIKQTLADFPKKIDNWQVQSSRESSEEVIKMLGVDDYIEYNYQGKENRGVNFYAAYYEAVGGGVGYHSPKNCIPGGGWGIETVRKVTLTPKGKETAVSVSEMVIRNGNEYQVVFFWFQNRGRIIYSEYWEKIYLVVDAILSKRRDGTFVRLMSYAPDGNLEQAEAVLKEFASLTITELENYLPGRTL